MLVGYARTSTAEQIAGLDAQERDLTAAGAEEMYREQASSVGTRAALVACLKFLRKGDALVVTKSRIAWRDRRANCWRSRRI
jgi:DNA invertase Pin-like site-specific DNA recombinase